MTRIVATTPRLVLREWSRGDADALAVLAKDPITMRYINGGVPYTDDEVAGAIERQLDTQATHGWCRWALELREPAAGQPLGVVGFAGPGCTFAPDVEVGWWLHRDLWGQGLAKEAARAAVDRCVHDIGFPRLICCVHPDNAASLAVAAHVGFTRYDEIEFRGFPIVRHELVSPDARLAPGYRHDCADCEPAAITVVRPAAR